MTPVNIVSLTLRENCVCLHSKLAFLQPNPEHRSLRRSAVCVAGTREHGRSNGLEQESLHSGPADLASASCVKCSFSNFASLAVYDGARARASAWHCRAGAATGRPLPGRGGEGPLHGAGLRALGDCGRGHAAGAHGRQARDPFTHPRAHSLTPPHAAAGARPPTCALCVCPPQTTRRAASGLCTS